MLFAGVLAALYSIEPRHVKCIRAQSSANNRASMIKLNITLSRIFIIYRIPFQILKHVLS